GEELATKEGPPAQKLLARLLAFDLGLVALLLDGGAVDAHLSAQERRLLTRLFTPAHRPPLLRRRSARSRRRDPVRTAPPSARAPSRRSPSPRPPPRAP